MSFFKRINVFLFALLFQLSLSFASAPEVVYLFTGQGADDRCMEGIEYTIKRFAQPKPQIIQVKNFEDLIVFLKAENRRSLLVMPGGSSVFYEELFTALIDTKQQYLIEQIRSGKLCYLGICAGAYFASTSYEVVIDKKTQKSEATAKRLAIFGEMTSAYDSFMSDSWGGARGVEALLDDAKTRTTLWNGGPALADDDGEVICRYESSKKPAIVAKVFAADDGSSESVAIVSGVHFELDVKREILAGSYMPMDEFNKIDPYDGFITKAVSLIFRKFGFQ